MDLVTDLGTESGVMAGIHSFFCNDPNSHRYVPSPWNQRIEGWWSFLKKNQTSSDIQVLQVAFNPGLKLIR